MPKYFLLTAGDQHYPESGDGDWKGFYETYDDAYSEIEKVCVIPGGNATYNIRGNSYEWYYIIDLTNRIN